MKFEELSFSEAPKIDGKLPGVKSKRLLVKQKEIEGKALSYPIGIPIVMDEGRGATIKDIDGNIFIDFFSGAGVLAVGHCNPLVLEAVEKQQRKITHTLDFPTEVRLELIEKIREIMPNGLKNNVKIQFGGPTGSDAVEAAVKLAKYNTKNHVLIAFEGGYHGQTAGACSLTSGKFWKEKYLPMIPEVHFVPYAYCYRCIFHKSREKMGTCDNQCRNYYEHILEDPHSGVAQPAATIIEAIQGEGGTIVPPNDYIKGISDINGEYGIPLIIDEIQTGFCRTGKMFSFQHSGATADIITLSKALGGGFPLSAIAYKEDFDIWTKGSHIGTFRGNVTAMAAGIASIDFILDNNLSDYTERLGKHFLVFLQSIEQNCEIVGEVRGKGLMIGIEIVNEKESKRPSAKLAQSIREECFKQGLLVEIGGHYNNVVRILPPLIITQELADTGLMILETVIEKIGNTSMR